METKTLSVFVDESGNFKFPDRDSRFYIVGLVIHDQTHSIDTLVADLERSEREIGLEDHCFHAGPLIRREKAYAAMSRAWRGRIFSRMMAFAHRVPFRYRCLSVDKKFIASVDQIVPRLQTQLAEFLRSRRADMESVGMIKVYYDCGQSPVTTLLHDTFTQETSCPVEFVQNVKPQRYRLFQIADLVCTLHLIELKIKAQIPMTPSEFSFFGSPRIFQHNILRRIKVKEI